MKRIICVLLIIICLFTLISCGSSETHYCGVCGDVATMQGQVWYKDEPGWYRCAACYRNGNYPTKDIIGEKINWTRVH